MSYLPSSDVINTFLQIFTEHICDFKLRQAYLDGFAFSNIVSNPALASELAAATMTAKCTHIDGAMLSIAFCFSENHPGRCRIYQPTESAHPFAAEKELHLRQFWIAVPSLTEGIWVWKRRSGSLKTVDSEVFRFERITKRMSSQSISLILVSFTDIR